MKSKNCGIAIKLYRFERFFYNHKMSIAAKVIRFLMFVICNCSIWPTTEIGEETEIKHSIGIVIHEKAKIGKNCKICQNVTIGTGHKGKVPEIGDNVYIGAGACILGGVKIGDNARIGANAVVLKDVPYNCTAVGVPAKIILPKE